MQYRRIYLITGEVNHDGTCHILISDKMHRGPHRIMAVAGRDSLAIVTHMRFSRLASHSVTIPLMSLAQILLAGLVPSQAQGGC